MLSEFQTKMPTWEIEENKWLVVVMQILDVEQYGVESKFLANNPLKVVDPSFLYVIKRNMGWRCSIYKSTITNMQRIETEIKCMYAGFAKDM